MGGWDKAPEYGSRGGWLMNGLAAITVIALGLTLANCAQESAKAKAESEEEPRLSAIGQTIEGTPTITDGDTIRFGERRIRFDGIDSPEEGKFCGALDIYGTARDALRTLIGTQTVICTMTDAPDRDGREVAQCSAGDVDLNARMVETGMARDWPRYSDGAYADEEATARAARLGVWAANCPADLWPADRDYSLQD